MFCPNIVYKENVFVYIVVCTVMWSGTLVQNIAYFFVSLRFHTHKAINECSRFDVLFLYSFCVIEIQNKWVYD